MRGGDFLRWLGFSGALVLTAATLLNAAATPGWPIAVPVLAVPVLAAAVAGMGTVVLAWGLLGRLVVVGGDAAPGPRALKRTFLLWGGPLLAAPPLFSGDVHSYLAQGAIAARGLDPYAVGPNQGLGPTNELAQSVGGYWRDAPSPYGPLFSVVQRLIAQVTGEQQLTGLLLYRLVALAGVALILWAVPRLAARAGIPENVALWLGVANPLVLWHFLAGVHNDALMLGLMLVGTVVALSAMDEWIEWRRLSGGVALIALAADVKLPAVVALAVVGTALARRLGGTLWHLAIAGTVMLAAVAVVSAVVSLVTGFGFGWLTTLGTSGQVNSWMAPTNWFGFLTGGIGSLFGLQITQTMIGVGKIVGYALIGFGAVVVIHRQLRGSLTELRALGLLLAVVVAFGPAVQPWYLLWAAVPLATCLPAGRARTALTALVALFAVLLPPFGGNFSGKVGQLVASYLAGVLVVAVVVFLTRRGAPERTTFVLHSRRR